MSMDSESEQMILDAVDKFLEADVRPYAHDLEARRRISRPRSSRR